MLINAFLSTTKMPLLNVPQGDHLMAYGLVFPTTDAANYSISQRLSMAKIIKKALPGKIPEAPGFKSRVGLFFLLFFQSADLYIIFCQ
jgi:hypothetical protein